MADTEAITSDMGLPALEAGSQLVKVVPTVYGMARIEEHRAWPVVSELMMTLESVIALREFKVRDLVRLEVGQVIESLCANTDDVPVKVGQVQVGWSEFEVVDQRLAVRLTRLA
ncbi:MAG TPA: FliM/FliN family flagellar motor C-terminal domain-containing protein [Edaphobacter sp.]|nr:FliM/FliN family flagellar motor C-terminal domain-containing protein [Edaphobacter sp.]